MKTKILIIGPSSTHVHSFIGLVQNSFDEIVYVGEQTLQTDFPIRQHIINFRSFNPWSIKKAKNKLKKIIIGENPSVVHIQQINRVAWIASGVLKKLKLKFVVTAWGSDVLIIPKQNVLYKKMVQQVLKRAEAVTADSKQMLLEIEKIQKPKSLQLVLFGINPIQSKEKEKIIYSNRALEFLYRIDLIIDLFAEFYKNNSNYQLVIAGTGNELNSLKLKVAQYKIEHAVKFVGWLTANENMDYYSRALVYVSIPESDGTSVSLLEAMSAGCIPIVSDLPVAHEWINHLENGIIVNDKMNPFLEALQMNQIQVASINSKLIIEKATKSISSEKLKSIYINLIRD